MNEIEMLLTLAFLDPHNEILPPELDILKVTGYKEEFNKVYNVGVLPIRPDPISPIQPPQPIRKPRPLK